MIELKNLTKRYGNTLAVNNLSLSVPRGEIYGFIGPNGAGKTTTIRIMGGVLAPTEGAVIIDGMNMADDPEAVKRKIGFIPDRPFIYEKLTGMEFMRFSGDLYGVDEKAFPDRARGLLQKFGIFNWADELIESYSHGMKQRLIISSALLHDPAVIVVDEPMVGLDPAAIKLVKDTFRDMARGGMTIFMSTHTLAVAEDICDRIGVIHKGSLIATGTTGDLKRDAGVDEADLESVFLILTQEQDAP
ncbi:MAG TPA: ABC transporter ATP-binding protein [Syntrophales bacterium]|nr:ABC transporter ATP-binding protein [Syntrophales bacterium]